MGTETYAWAQRRMRATPVYGHRDVCVGIETYAWAQGRMRATPVYGHRDVCVGRDVCVPHRCMGTETYACHTGGFPEGMGTLVCELQ